MPGQLKAYVMLSLDFSMLKIAYFSLGGSVPDCGALYFLDLSKGISNCTTPTAR